jgi:hypothetical protein
MNRCASTARSAASTRLSRPPTACAAAFHASSFGSSISSKSRVIAPGWNLQPARARVCCRLRPRARLTSARHLAEAAAARAGRGARGAGRGARGAGRGGPIGLSLKVDAAHAVGGAVPRAAAPLRLPRQPVRVVLLVRSEGRGVSD